MLLRCAVRAIAGLREQLPEQRQLLGIDVLVVRLECLDFAVDGHDEMPLVRLSDLTDRLQQRDDVMPLDVVAQRVPKDLRQRVLVVAVQALFCRFLSSSSARCRARGLIIAPWPGAVPGSRAPFRLVVDLAPGCPDRPRSPALAVEVGRRDIAGDAEEVFMRFRDRVDAGRRLAQVVRSADLGGRDVAVLGLPRGGVPVAFEVATALRAPLDVLVVRKLGVPFQPELAMGAIGEGGVRVENTDVLGPSGLSAADLDEAERRERVELDRRAAMYRRGRDRLDVSGRSVVVVDDGVATGSSARAACQVARALGAAHIVLAVPVASRTAALELSGACDEVVCVELPERFFAVGEWYRDFSATSDDQVVELLRRAAPLCHDDEVEIRCGTARLAGSFAVPPGPTGTVVFVHGSGSSRRSPRNRHVAAVLQRAGLATLLVDLLSPQEERDRASVFDVRLLASRLGDVTRWAADHSELSGVPLGYFGASTGAAAALWSAAQPDCRIEAVVSRGGRPDLAAPLLPAVTAPTLLIVGERDGEVLALNRRAQAEMTCENHLTVIPDASHLFEEPGALDAVAEAARDWFTDKLGPETA